MVIGPFEAAHPLPPSQSLWFQGLLRGFRRRCPHCGQGALFSSYIKQNDFCPACGTNLGEFRADDAPAYFTILIVGHIVVPAMLLTEMHYHPSMSLHLALWIPLTLGLTVFLLPRVKGALIGLQWALKLRQ